MSCTNEINNGEVQKDYIVDLRNLYAAKKANDQRLRSDSCQGANMRECIKINEDLDRELHRLQTLKQMYNLKDFVEPEDMYLLDPTNKTNRSNFVKYSPDMYNINVGVQTCNTEGCNTSDDDIFKINPNVVDNFKKYEEQYMLAPKSNIVTPKFTIEEKQQFKLYPHMFSDTYNLMKEQEREDNQPGGISVGGVDFPIPMRFKMKYLQQPGHKGMSHNIDYDIHIKRKSNNLPEWHDKITDRDLNIRKQDSIQQNRQRMINAGYGGDDFTPPSIGALSPLYENPTTVNSARDALIRQRTGNSFDLVAQNANISRSAIKNAANNVNRTYGFYPDNSQQYDVYDGRIQTNREEQHAKDIMNQPLDWYKYKGMPRTATTLTQQQYNDMLVSEGSANIIRQNGPSAEAQRSGFFQHGPPIPPPNPELLSAIPSEMLVNRTRLATLKDSSGFKVPIPEDRDEYLLKTDLEHSIKPFKLTDGEIGHLMRPPGPGVDQPPVDIARRTPTQQYDRSLPNDTPLIEKFDQLATPYKFPNKESQCGIPPVKNNVSYLKDLWFSKELALQRIKFQIAHLQRLEPTIRQKQIHAKELNYTINIVKTTKWLEKIKCVLNTLKHSQSLIKEERNEIIYKLSNKPFNLSSEKIKEIQGELNVILKKEALSAAKDRSDFAAGGDHYFSKIPKNAGVFYTQSNFQGKGIRLPYGFYDYPKVGGIENNKLASFKIPANSTLKLYEHPKKGGVELVYYGPSRVAFLPDRWTNRISGIELIDAPPPYDGKFYSGMNYQGNETLLKPGFYDYPNLGGIGNKQVASFKIPKELMITLYSRPNKEGQKVTYIGPYNMENMGVSWTNNVMGIEIQVKSTNT